MKLIFLDIDGVLNHEGIARLRGIGRPPILTHKHQHFPECYRELARLDPVAVNILNELCKNTGAEVVISSTWRMLPDFDLGGHLDYWNDLFMEITYYYNKINHIEVIGMTQVNNLDRGEQILQFLEDVEECESFVALDDDSKDITPHIPDNFVLVQGRIGFNMIDYDKAYNVLMK